MTSFKTFYYSKGKKQACVKFPLKARILHIICLWIFVTVLWVVRSTTLHEPKADILILDPVLTLLGPPSECSVSHIEYLHVRKRIFLEYL